MVSKVHAVLENLLLNKYLYMYLFGLPIHMIVKWTNFVLISCGLLYLTNRNKENEEFIRSFS